MPAKEEPVSPALDAIAEKYWDATESSSGNYTSWGNMLNAVKDAYELGRKDATGGGEH